MLRLSSRSVRSIRTLPTCQIPKRSVVTVPELHNINNFKNEGIDGLYSAKGLQNAWFDRVEQLVEYTNIALEASEISQVGTTEDLIRNTFNEPNQVELNLVSSILHNLKFSKESITKSDQKITKATDKDFFQNTLIDEFTNIPTDGKLVKLINDNFGSLIEFRTLLLNSAYVTKGDGFTWLVAKEVIQNLNKVNVGIGSDKLSTKSYNYYIMNTYNGGIVDDSIRSGQIEKWKLYNRLLDSKKNTPKSETEGESNGTGASLKDKLFVKEQQNEIDLENSKTIEDYSFISSNYSKTKTIPLLAIDVSPKAYLTDYGVFGKRKYLYNCWESIDWDIILQRLNNLK